MDNTKFHEPRYSNISIDFDKPKFHRKKEIHSLIAEVPSVRFSRSLLLKSLENFSKGIQLIPIEHFEIELFRVTKFHQIALGSKSVSIKCVERLHHIQMLSEEDYNLDNYHKSLLKNRVEVLVGSSPLITSEYSIFKSLVDISNGLLVKWGISDLKRYDYRYSGRSLNVKMIDLNIINENLMSLDVIWIATKLDSPPLNVISTPALLEYAKLLKDQIGICFNIFLNLNSKNIDPNYDIERVIAYRSRRFYSFIKEVLPEQNLTSFKHTELGLVKGVMKCFRNSDPKVDLAFEALRELEMAYMSFEKHLISNILKSNGKADF